MQESRQTLHDKQANSECSPQCSANDEGEGTDNNVRAASQSHALLHHLYPEHIGKLRVSERQSPQTKVASSIADCTKDKLNCVNDLMYDDFRKVFLFFFFSFFFLFIIILLACAQLRRSSTKRQGLLLFLFESAQFMTPSEHRRIVLSFIFIRKKRSIRFSFFVTMSKRRRMMSSFTPY